MSSKQVDITIEDEDSENEIDGTDEIFTEESYQFIEIDNEQILNQIFLEDRKVDKDIEYEVFTTELIVNTRSGEEIKKDSQYSIVVVILILIFLGYIIYRVVKSKKSYVFEHKV